MVTERISDIHIIIQNRLQTFTGHILVHGIKTAVVVDLKLLVTFDAVKGDEQFEIDDARSFETMYKDMSGEGLQPVLNDYVYV